MKNILVLAYTISPSRGSEYAVAWNYVVRMSKYNRLTVLFGTSGDHMGDTGELESYAKDRRLDNVRFVAVKPNARVRGLNWLNRHGYFVYTYYFAYQEWQKQAYGKAKELLAVEHFDLVHFVGMIGFREPGYLWKLGLPYMWGPVGGANLSSKVLQKNIPKIAKLKFSFRNWATRYQLKHKKRLRKVVENADLILTATTENQTAFNRMLGAESLYLPENAILGEIKLDTCKFRMGEGEKYHFVIVGRLVAGKAVNILLEALTMVKNRDKMIVDIVGDGPMRASLEAYAKEHGLSGMIEWHGQLPRTEAIKIFESAHMHVITSISEANTTVIFEAMSYGVPTISFDHCGMHDTVCERCGIKIPIDSYEQSVADLAKNIDDLLESPRRFEMLAKGTVECAQSHTWEAREKFLLACYDKTIENHKKRSRKICRQ